MRLKITLEHNARYSALQSRLKREIPTPDNFEGPEFNNVVDVDICDGFVFVHLEGEVIYGYPVVHVARLAQYPE